MAIVAALGTEGVAALVASIAGAGLQYSAQQSALKKQQQTAVDAQRRQLAARNEATQIAARKAGEFDPGARQQQQQDIQQQLTGELDKQVAAPQITAQGVQVGTTLPSGAGGTAYLTAQAKEQAKATASLRELAALMGRIGGASQLREKEAVGIGDAAGAIGRVQNGAENIFGVDQVGIGAAGQPNVGMMLAGEALRAGGQYGMAKTSTKKPENVNAGSAWA